MDLQQKVMNAFIGKVVRKDLAFLVGRPACSYLRVGIPAGAVLRQR